MDRRFDFASASTSRIVVGRGIASQLPAAVAALRPDGVVLVHDRALTALAQPLGAAIGARAMLAISGGEAQKRLEHAGRLASELGQLGATRGTLLVVLGGGTLTDLVGFVASIYQRGIACAYCPTTTLAMCDAALGGKNGIDHDGLKNQLGAIRQPELVFADVDWLASLPAEQFREGLVEVVKMAAVLDAQQFARLEALAPALANREAEATLETVAMAVAMKMAVVLADEREAGLRATLNFGHTIGHAIESLSNETIRHGSAIAMGLVAECRAAGAAVPMAVTARLDALLARIGVATGIPAQFANAEALWQFAQRDKKARGGRVPMVVPRAIGERTTVELTAASLALALA